MLRITDIGASQRQQHHPHGLARLQAASCQSKLPPVATTHFSAWVASHSSSASGCLLQPPRSIPHHPAPPSAPDAAPDANATAAAASSPSPSVAALPPALPAIHPLHHPCQPFQQPPCCHLPRHPHRPPRLPPSPAQWGYPPCGAGRRQAVAFFSCFLALLMS